MIKMALNDHPIIAAVRDEQDIVAAVKSPAKIVFLLKEDINSIKEHVEYLKKHNKYVLIHFDLLSGFSKDSHALRFIAKNINIDGVITTKNNIIQEAKKMNLYTVQRLFLLDSMALESGIKSMNEMQADAVEIIPGLMPSIIEEIVSKSNVSIITGGLIRSKNDVIQALSAGALGVSSSNKKIWYL